MPYHLTRQVGNLINESNAVAINHGYIGGVPRDSTNQKYVIQRYDLNVPLSRFSFLVSCDARLSVASWTEVKGAPLA